MTLRSAHWAAYWAICIAALALGGCEGDLPKATDIERMRILGAKLEVVGDLARATPKPGERVRVSLTTVFPSLEQDTGSMQTLLIGCTAPERYAGGIPICQELIDFATDASQQDVEALLPIATRSTPCSDDPNDRLSAGTLSLHCVAGDPVAELQVPSDFKAEEMLFLGVVCERGTPVVNPTDSLLFDCEGNDGETLRVHGIVPIRHANADENHNPDLASALDLAIDGRNWSAFDPATLPPEEDCESAPEDDSLPQQVGGDHTIALRYDADARERTGGELETVELTIYATAGDMARRFTLFRSDAEVIGGQLASEVDWSPPKATDLPKGGQLVRFFITARDQRGGYDTTSRALCVH